MFLFEGLAEVSDGAGVLTLLLTIMAAALHHADNSPGVRCEMRTGEHIPKYRQINPKRAQNNLNALRYLVSVSVFVYYLTFMFSSHQTHTNSWLFVLFS